MTSEYQNLKKYYKSLSKKWDFVRKVADRCDVSSNSVLKWCYGDGKTQNEKFLSILSEETNIPVDKLFSR